MRLKYSPAARRDIERFYRESAKTFGPMHADAYYDGLIEALERIRLFPETAPVRRNLRGEVRIWRYRSHHLVYRIVANEVAVVRILHGRVDIGRHLKP